MILKKENSWWFIPVLAWCIYITAYLGRINLSITIMSLEHELGFSKTRLGFLASGFFMAYASGQIINGILGDRLPLRTFITTGLLVAALSNIFFSLTRSFPLLVIFWSANGYFQSMLWGPLSRAISEAVPQDKHFKAMFLMSTSPVIGHFLAYVLAGWLSVSFGWNYAFLVPGILLLASAVMWYWGSTPRTGTQSRDNLTRKPQISFSFKELGHFIYKSKLYSIIMLGVLIGLVKEGLTLWSPSMLSELYFKDITKMLFVISLMPLANFGFVISGGILNRKFHSNEKPVILILLSCAIVSALLVWLLRSSGEARNIIFYFSLMASLYAANNQMTSFIPLHYKKEGRVSAAAGIIDCSFYLGAAAAGPLIGMAAENFGWNGIFGGILIISTAAALIPGVTILRTYFNTTSVLPKPPASGLEK